MLSWETLGIDILELIKEKRILMVQITLKKIVGNDIRKKRKNENNKFFKYSIY